MSTVIAEIVALFERKGRVAYLGEGVSMAEHMLQTARAAECDGAPPPLVVAALLHDIGHLVHGMDDDSADHGIDTAHEVAGARWLERAFGPDVTEPIRLHVAAKRYLCATEPEYLAVLSRASVHTMVLQGGPFTPDEAAAFATTNGAGDAVRVRRWDDAGKVVGGTTPPLDHYLPLLAACRRP